MEIVIMFCSCFLGSLIGVSIGRSISKFINHKKVETVALYKENMFRPALETAKKVHKQCELMQKK